MVQGRRRDPEREARWRQALTQQAHSGLSVRAFCRQEGLPEPGFHAWRRIIRERDAAARRGEDPARPAFLPVRLQGQEGRPDDGNITIELRGGRVLRLPAWMSPTDLAAVVHAIEARPANVEDAA